MIVTNLASKPRLNTRPVWTLTAVAGLITVVLMVVNVRLFVSSSQNLEIQLVRRETLQTERQTLATTFEGHDAVLNKVPWRGLGSRINAVNALLAEHSFSWSEMLDRLAKVLPWQVRVVSVAPVVEGGVVNLGIQAVSQDRDGFLELLDRMVADPHFVDPLPKHEMPPEAGGVGYRFVMTVTYIPNTKETAEAGDK